MNWSETYNLFESWLFWRLKNLVQYGWPPKNNLKPSTYVTTETNCGVCCQIKCTGFGEKMYCFAKRTWTDIFLKKTYKWSTGTWKDAQHHWSLETCKSKSQWHITSHLSEWLLSKRQQISVDQDVKKREPSYTIGGNANWYSHYGKQYGTFSKN